MVLLLAMSLLAALASLAAPAPHAKSNHVEYEYVRSRPRRNVTMVISQHPLSIDANDVKIHKTSHSDSKTLSRVVNIDTYKNSRYHINVEPQQYKKTCMNSGWHRSKRRILPLNGILKGHHLFHKIHNKSRSSSNVTKQNEKIEKRKLKFWHKLIHFKLSNFTKSTTSNLTENTNSETNKVEQSTAVETRKVEESTAVETNEDQESTSRADENLESETTSEADEDLDSETTLPAIVTTEAHNTVLYNSPSNAHDETKTKTQTETTTNHAETTSHAHTTIIQVDNKHANVTVNHSNNTVSHAVTTKSNSETTKSHTETTISHTETTKSHTETTISHAEIPDKTTAKTKILDWLLHPHISHKYEYQYEIKKKYYMSVLVVADRGFLKFHRQKDYDTYILTVMNMAADYLHDVTLGVNIELVLVRTMYLEEQARQFGINNRTECLLEKFCCWAHAMNPRDAKHPHNHDVAIFITRKKMSPENGTCGLLGASYRGGACVARRSCIIAEDTGLALGINIAHQLGHLLGAPHDDGLDGRCPSESAEKLSSSMVFRHVMAPTPRHGTLVWSVCSRQSVAAFLSQGFGSCLEDEPPKTWLTFPEILPGIMYDADNQCHLLLPGSKACYINPLEFCQKLFCRVGAAACLSIGEMPAQGTPCGVNKWCFNGVCIHTGERPGAINGGWGAWGGWSPCTRSCGAGVESSERACDSPAPGFGGRYCLGDSRRFRTCNTQACHFKQASFRSVQCSEFDNIVIASQQHTWSHLEVRPSDRCGLYCLNEIGVMVRLKRRVVDGTPCRDGARDMCIGGACMKVGCDWVIGSSAYEDRCGICGGDGLHCHLVQAWYNYTNVHNKGYKLIAVIPKGSRKIRVYEADPSENSFAISNTTSLNEEEEFYLVGDKTSGTEGEFVIDTVIGIYMHWCPGAEMIMINGPLPFDIRLYLILNGMLAPIHYSYMDVHLLEKHADKRSIEFSRASTNKVPEVIRMTVPEKTTIQIPERTNIAIPEHTNIDLPKLKSNKMHKSITAVTESNEKPELTSIGVPEETDIDLPNLKSYKIQLIRASNEEPEMAIEIPQRKNMIQEKSFDLLKETRTEGAADTIFNAQRRQERNPFLERNNPFHWNRYQWEYLDWSPCSARCEVGTSISMPHCVSVWFGRVSDSYCDPTRKPEPKVRVCNEQPCLARWAMGPWSKCHHSLQCRPVRCVRESRSYSSAYTILNGRYCRSLRPATVRPCAAATYENGHISESEIFELSKLQPVTEAATTQYYIAVLDPNKRSPFSSTTCQLNATEHGTFAPNMQVKVFSLNVSTTEMNKLITKKTETINTRNCTEILSPSTHKSSKNSKIVSSSVLYYQTKTTEKKSVNNIKTEDKIGLGRTIMVTAKIPTTAQVAYFNINTERENITRKCDVVNSVANPGYTTSYRMTDPEEVTSKVDTTATDCKYTIIKKITDDWTNQEPANLNVENEFDHTTGKATLLNYNDDEVVTYNNFRNSGNEEYDEDGILTHNDGNPNNAEEQLIIREDDGKIGVSKEVEEITLTTEPDMPISLEMISDNDLRRDISEVYTESYLNSDKINSSMNPSHIFLKENKISKISELRKTIFSKTRNKINLKERFRNICKRNTYNYYKDSDETIKNQSLSFENKQAIQSESNEIDYALDNTRNLWGKEILVLKIFYQNNTNINRSITFANLNGSIDASNNEDNACVFVQLSKDNLNELNKLFVNTDKIKLVFKDDNFRNALSFINNKINTTDYISCEHPRGTEEFMNKPNYSTENETSTTSTGITDKFGNKIYDFDDLIKHINPVNETKISKTRANNDLPPNEFITKIPLKIYKTIMSVDGTTFDVPDSQSTNEELNKKIIAATFEKELFKPLDIFSPRVQYYNVSRTTTGTQKYKIPDRNIDTYLKSMSQNIMKKVGKPNRTISLNLKGTGVTIQTLYNIINIYCDSNQSSIIKDTEGNPSFELLDQLFDIKSSNQTIEDYVIGKSSNTLERTKLLKDENKMSTSKFKKATSPSIMVLDIVGDKTSKHVIEPNDGFIEITLRPLKSKKTKKDNYKDKDKKLSFFKKYKFFKTKNKSYPTSTTADGLELPKIKSRFKRYILNPLKLKSTKEKYILEKTTPCVQTNKVVKFRSLLKRIKKGTKNVKSLQTHPKMDQTIKDYNEKYKKNASTDETTSKSTIPYIFVKLGTNDNEHSMGHNLAQHDEENIPQYDEDNIDDPITTIEFKERDIKIIKDFMSLNDIVYERVPIVGINEFKKSLSDAADRENGDEVPKIYTGPKKLVHGSNAPQLILRYYNQSFDVS